MSRTGQVGEKRRGAENRGWGAGRRKGRGREKKVELEQKRRSGGRQMWRRRERYEMEGIRSSIVVWGGERVGVMEKW